MQQFITMVGSLSSAEWQICQLQLSLGSMKKLKIGERSDTSGQEFTLLENDSCEQLYKNSDQNSSR